MNEIRPRLALKKALIELGYFSNPDPVSTTMFNCLDCGLDYVPNVKEGNNCGRCNYNINILNEDDMGNQILPLNKFRNM